MIPLSGRAACLGGLLLIGLTGQAQGDACKPTVGVPFGNEYKRVVRNDARLGSDLVVRGQVLSESDCQPVRGARVEYWQAGRDGRYHDRLRAYQTTDAGGRFEFRTEWPGLPPPHIHFRIDAPGHATLVSIWQQTAQDRRPDALTLRFVLERR